MTESVACRGPDDAGIWLNGQAGLGHRRLAIVDREGGHQPMVADVPGGKVGLTYCGEVYNAAELRSILTSLGHSFRTRSDTEVILRGYLQWGEHVAPRLNGMFAFAIWDSRSCTLLMARDPLGIKPLYFHCTPDSVLFGSEPKAIFAHTAVQRVVTSDGLRQLLLPLKIPGQSIWAGIREVRPGSVVTVNADGISERRYWVLTRQTHRDDLQETIAVVRGLLEDIVQRHLIADVPRCVLLSGGLDSSAIAALSARTVTADAALRTFAVDVIGAGTFRPDPLRATPDGPFVHEVARHLGTLHTDLRVNAQDVASAAVRRATVAARDAPGLGDVDQTLYLLFRQIRCTASVALSGEGADEVFGGYAELHDPAAVRSPVFPWMASRFGWHRSLPRLLERDCLRLLRLDEFVSDTYRSALAEVPTVGHDCSSERRMHELGYLHAIHFLPQLLDRKDRMSMASGVEVRVPFCDHRLVEYVFNVPWSMKTFDGREKGLLRAAVRDLLPDTVVARRKSVYPTLHNEEYVEALQSQVRELVDEGVKRQVFDIYRRDVAAEIVSAPAKRVGTIQRMLCERVLELDAWLEMRRPTLSWP